MTQQYQELTEQLAALVDAKWPMISNLANAAALLYEKLGRLNWAGFYLTDNHVLWLGPFQGKTACVRIAEGKGVCGTAYRGLKMYINFRDISRATQHPGRKSCFRFTKTAR